MQKEIIAEIAVIAAKEALAVKDTIFAEAFDARFHDVKLLMKNYRRLKSHYDFTSKKRWKSFLSILCIIKPN